MAPGSDSTGGEIGQPFRLLARRRAERAARGTGRETYAHGDAGARRRNAAASVHVAFVLLSVRRGGKVTAMARRLAVGGRHATVDDLAAPRLWRSSLSLLATPQHNMNNGSPVFVRTRVNPYPKQ